MDDKGEGSSLGHLAPAMLSRVLLPLLIALAFVGVGGCAADDPHAIPIKASSSSGLGRWRMKTADSFTRDEWREFDAALQEIRLRVMAERQASGSEAVQEAMCSRIDGLTFREVLVLGHEATLARLRPVRDELKRSVDTNALLVTKPGDRKSADYLNDLNRRQMERLRKIDTEIAVAEGRLATRGKSAGAQAGAKHSGPDEAAPVALSRETALEQIAQMMHEQRAAALFKYGAWPLKIVRDGAGLPVQERADFMARRETAGANRNVVIAVRLRDRWWIYDGPAESPSFSRAVTANLTETDRREIDAKWWDLQAELWARREAFEPL